MHREWERRSCLTCFLILCASLLLAWLTGETWLADREGGKPQFFFENAEATACYANAIFGLVLKKKSQTPVENKKTKKKHTQHACEVTWRVLKKINLTFNDNTSFRIITKLWKVNVKWVNSTLFIAGARSSYMDYGISWIGLLSIWHDLEFIQSSK